LAGGKYARRKGQAFPIESAKVGRGADPLNSIPRREARISEIFGVSPMVFSWTAAQDGGSGPE
jgi:hypothetical protein